MLQFVRIGLFCGNVLVLWYLVFWGRICIADTYTYIDRNGTVVMTDSRDSIPKEYRKKVKVTKEAPQPKPVSQPAFEPPAEISQAVPQQSVIDDRPWYRKYSAPAACVAAILIVLYAVRKFSVMIGQPKVGMLFFVIVSLAAGVYFYKHYVDSALETYQALKRDAENIKKNVEKRDTMTDKSVQGIKE